MRGVVKKPVVAKEAGRQVLRTDCDPSGAMQGSRNIEGFHHRAARARIERGHINTADTLCSHRSHQNIEIDVRREVVGLDGYGAIPYYAGNPDSWDRAAVKPAPGIQATRPRSSRDVAEPTVNRNVLLCLRQPNHQAGFASIGRRDVKDIFECAAFAGVDGLY